VDPTSFRAQFPVLERCAYLNAGTEGPIPARAIEAAQAQLRAQRDQGRCGRPYFEATMELASRLRAAYAQVLGCEPDLVALTGSTTDGVNTVLSALDLRPGEEILTSDQEHPGLLAPLARARRTKEIEIRVVPFAEIANHIRPSTRLVACSHVSWASGQVVDTAALAASVPPVLLDAAQALGAIPSPVKMLGCDFYACSGQKWLCGPEGSGCLYVAAERIAELEIPWPSYASLADAHRPLDLEPATGATRFDLGFPSVLRSAFALASLDVLREAGWEWVYERAAGLAGGLAQRLQERGIEVLPREGSTLVSFRLEGSDADVQVTRLAAEGVIVRSVPIYEGVLRASVGAWTDEGELERLVELVAR
jgi:selenocysteine lyase/cysteine desulfurase